jgi:hypothetical protein
MLAALASCTAQLREVTFVHSCALGLCSKVTQHVGSSWLPRDSLAGTQPSCILHVAMRTGLTNRRIRGLGTGVVWNIEAAAITSFYKFARS